MRKHAPVLAGTCDLLVCDEGHRLKSAGGSKTMDALLSIGCERRVVLTGTPVQNNLEELFKEVGGKLSLLTTLQVADQIVSFTFLTLSG